MMSGPANSQPDFMVTRANMLEQLEKTMTDDYGSRQPVIGGILSKCKTQRFSQHVIMADGILSNPDIVED